MCISWTSFRSGVQDQRFLQPLHSFEYKVEWVDTTLSSENVVGLVDFISHRVVSEIQQQPDCELFSLNQRMNQNPSGVSGQTVSGAESYYYIAEFGNPVYDFHLQVGPNRLTLTKNRTSQEELILSVNLFRRIIASIFGEDDFAPKSPPKTLFDVFPIYRRLYRCSFAFYHRFQLSHHIADRSEEASNLEVSRKLLRLSLDNPSSTGRDCPIGALNPESINRCDANISFRKTLGGKPRELWLNYEGPSNINYKDLDLMLLYRSGRAEEPLTHSDLIDWDTPILEFYRDVVINRLFKDMFHDMELQTKLW